jgi:hypothetical protein
MFSELRVEDPDGNVFVFQLGTTALANVLHAAGYYRS